MMNIGDRVQTINTLCPISGTIVDIYDNLIVISDDDAETDVNLVLEVILLKKIIMVKMLLLHYIVRVKKSWIKIIIVKKIYN